MQEEKRSEYNPLLLPHPPHHPELIAGRKGLEGEEKGVRGLARKGFRWPSGARPSQPQPSGPGSGGRYIRNNSVGTRESQLRTTSTQRRGGAEKKRRVLAA